MRTVKYSVYIHRHSNKYSTANAKGKEKFLLKNWNFLFEFFVFRRKIPQHEPIASLHISSFNFFFFLFQFRLLSFVNSSSFSIRIFFRFYFSFSHSEFSHFHYEIYIDNYLIITVEPFSSNIMEIFPVLSYILCHCHCHCLSL